MHQFTRPPQVRRPSGPEVDIVDVLPEPHAPIRPSSGSARQSLPRRKQPMHRVAHRHAPMPGDASPGAGQHGMRRSKQGSTQMQKRCTQSTRMGLGPAWRCTADIARPNPASRADAADPVPSACFASICLHLRKPLLASPRAAPCRDEARQRRSQNPVRRFTRLPPLRRHSGPGPTRLACGQKPLHQIPDRPNRSVVGMPRAAECAALSRPTPVSCLSRVRGTGAGAADAPPPPRAPSWHRHRTGRPHSGWKRGRLTANELRRK